VLPGWLRNLSLLGVATALSLLGAEGVARLLFPPSSAPQNVTSVGKLTGPSPWPGMRRRLVPGATQQVGFRGDPRGYLDPGATLTYRINQLGFRGRETSWEKPAGHVRVVGLGDSFTFGAGVRVGDTFLAVLEERLRSDGGPHPIEVLNLGVGGVDTAYEAKLLQQLGLRLSPDLVVLTFFLNDAGGGGTTDLFNDADSQGAPWRRSRLLDRLVSAFQRPQRVQQLIANYRRSFRPEAPGWIAAQSGLREVAALSESHGFDLVVMIFPVLWKLSGDHPFREIHEIVRAAAEALGIPVFDLLPAFAGHDGPELWVNSTDQHPNEIAHAIAGEALYRFLASQSLPRPH
jgi:lysophospholipase L1-like esterase